MNKKHFLSVLGFATLLSTSALAQDSLNAVANAMADGSAVTVKGTVDSVENENEFTLRDSTGKVSVDAESADSAILNVGQEVTVSGKVDKGLLGADIKADHVLPHKGLAKNISDTLKSLPGVSTVDAQAFSIRDLPDAGAVKVSGIVTDVQNEKEFTLRDATGSISIDVASSENAVLKEGAEVTVIGSIDNGLLKKDINAYKVLIVADAKKTASN